MGIFSYIINEKFNTFKSTNQPKYYFVSAINMNDELLQPRIPDNFLTRIGAEDNKTPRVCFSDSIDGCLIALSRNLKGMKLFVHVADCDESILRQFRHPTAKEVPDADITDEVWSLKPIEIKCIGQIQVKKAYPKPLPYKYTDRDGTQKTAELYSWDWKWIYRFDEDSICNESEHKSKLQKEVEEVFGECRDTTREEQQSILNHIKNISEPTGINFYDEYIEESNNDRNNILNIVNKALEKENMKAHLSSKGKKDFLSGKRNSICLGSFKKEDYDRAYSIVRDALRDKSYTVNKDNYFTIFVNDKQKLSESYIEENYIFSNNDLYINFEKFESGKCNICLVTGLSGSGKSTIASSLVSKYHAKWIELDNFECCYGFTDEQLKQAGQVFYDYLSSHKDIWDKLKSKSIKGKDLGVEINKFVHYCISWCARDKKNKYIIEGVQIYSFMKYKEIKSYSLIIKNTSMIKSIIQRWKRNGNGKIDLIKELNNEFPQLVAWYKDEEKSLNQFRNSIEESKSINNESYIEETTSSSMNRKYRCPYCDNLYKRKDLPRHIENKHEDLIPKEMTPLQITFNTVNNKTHGTCTECGEDSPWNEEKGRYDRICSKKSCHDSYVKKMKSRMIKKYGKEHILDDAQVQKRMLENRKISGTYVWSDGHKFSYCGSYEKALLEFLDKVLNCKSEDIVTPGPVIDYSYNGKIHKWIMDVYYIPYNLCIDVKDGGSNPNNRPMEEYREKQEAKEQSLSKLGKFNYIRLTDNDFTQLFDIFLELKMNLLENDNSKVININEQCSTTINALPPISQEKGEYIIQYMMKNTFTKGYGYCTNNELTDDIHIIDSFGKSKILHRDEFLNMVDEYTIFKYNGNHIEESYEYDSYPIDYYYTKLTGRRLLDDKQIFVDSDFCIETKLEDKLEALKEVYMSSLNNTSILENEIGFDRNGIYKYNPQTGLRTKSYDSLEKINKDEIKIIGL